MPFSRASSKIFVCVPCSSATWRTSWHRYEGRPRMLKYRAFLRTVIDFLIIAFVITPRALHPLQMLKPSLLKGSVRTRCPLAV
jgi:large-conductance mechanosensitive channel